MTLLTASADVPAFIGLCQESAVPKSFQENEVSTKYSYYFIICTRQTVNENLITILIQQERSAHVRQHLLSYHYITFEEITIFNFKSSSTSPREFIEILGRNSKC